MTKHKPDREEAPVPQAIEDLHALLVWILPQLDKMPRARRYTLGAHIENGLLFVLEKLLEAAYSRERKGPLRAANLRLEVVRHLWRLALESRAISKGAWSHGVGLMLDVGRQIGGWQRSVTA